MRTADAQWIPSSPQQTWDALLDPAVLQDCLPGCVSVTQIAEREYQIAVRATVAGLEAEYEGEVLLSDLRPDESLALAFEGKGAAAGMAIGTAQLQLTPKDHGTRLAYTLAVMTGGPLAALGDPPLTKAGHRLIEKFFSRFIDHMARQPRQAPPPPPPEPPAKGLAASRWSWVAVLLILALLVSYHLLFK